MARYDYYHHTDAPKPTRIVPAVSAVVHNADGKIVLHLRADNGYWALPGGEVEVGETVSDAIHREVQEETGLRVEIAGLVGIYSDPGHVIAYDNGEVRQQFSICFSCPVIDGTLSISGESRSVRLFNQSEINNLMIHPANKIRLNDFFSHADKPFLR